MNRTEIAAAIPDTFGGLEEAKLPPDLRFYRGKVRDILDLDDRMVLCTTDRISAFDRILTTIPYKGDVLNSMSLYWFEKTEDIVQNHLAERISSRTVVVKKYDLLPVEVVIRAYLTGSSWRDYRKDGTVSGIKLPGGMRFNQKFEQPLLTPSTKAEQGAHDRPISVREIIGEGIVDEKLWKAVEEAAFALFARGTELAAEQGLILVDTKYEFGISGGKPVLVDEIHTPDSSRYWYADTYEELFEKGEKQRKIDKEYLRQWLMAQGFMGDGEQPEIPDSIRTDVAEKYITAFETITGEEFAPDSGTPEEETEKILTAV